MTNRRSDTDTGETLFEKVLNENVRGKMKQVMGELRLPKEALNYILKQVDNTRDATVETITKEFRKYLQETDLSQAMSDLLSQISLEITTNIQVVKRDPKKNGIRIKVSATESETTSSDTDVNTDENTDENTDQSQPNNATSLQDDSTT